MYEVGTAFGIKDHCTGRAAHAIIVDGDTVLCTFHGSRAEENCKRIAGILNEADAQLYL